ncbi:MAG: leucine-rich repeat domain-containing protein, partial [Clostridia bacterium]|nr:leucine-rich repeat domain-containing protein [Clostridia bacterium]
SVVVFNKFLAGAEEEFVPKAKLRVSYDCSTISVRLIQAAFDRFVWKEGEYQESGVKFDNFFEEASAKAANRALNDEGYSSRNRRSPKKDEEKPVKQKKQKKAKKEFILKDGTSKNVSRVPAVLNVIIFFVLVAFMVATVLIFKKNTSQLTVSTPAGQFYLHKNSSEGKAGIYGYDGDETELEIPEKIGGYTITNIEPYTFKKSNVVSVTYTGNYSNFVINSNAFYDCPNLQSVSSANCAVSAQEAAFVNCAKLTTVNLGGHIDPNAFVNCPNYHSGTNSGAAAMTLCDLTPYLDLSI